MRPHRLALSGLVAALLAPVASYATNGYFSHGYGVKALGQAGVGVAWAQDSLAAATNPAGTLEVGDRVDLGLTWFAPKRGAQVGGNAFGADASYSGDGKKNFFIPEFGYAQRLSSTLAAGVSVYGNGGMNTEYRDNPYARFGATGTAGVNLEQLFISPSVAWQLNADHRIGAALNLAYQRFSARGIAIFGGFSTDAAHVSDQGTDSTTGAGVRVGWAGNVAPGVTMGATWSSKIRGKFDDYRGLFADGGRFDVPENYALGVKLAPNAAWSLGADVQTIRYSRVAAVGNSIAGLLQGTPLGAPAGSGFGWRDVTVLKLAVSHQWSPDLQLRAGISHARQPVPAGETFFNILAPGVVQDHVTVGATRTLGGGELSGFFVYAPRTTVKGSNSIPPGNPPGGFGGGNANVHLKETILGVSYGWKL